MSKGSWSILPLVMFLLSSYIFAMFQGGFVSWFLFFSLLFITVSTFVWYLAWFKGLTVDRVLVSKQAVAGEAVEVQIKVKNKWRVPYAYLLIRDRVEAKQLVTGPEEMLVYPWFKKKLVLTYRLSNLPRGLLRFQSISLQTGDLFGFVEKKCQLIQGREVFVYPYVEELTAWQIGKAGRQGRLRSKFNMLEDMTSVTGIREYRVGDRLSHVHWKASARSTGLKTKEFEQHVSDELVFFLDREERAYANEDETLFERGVSLTASLVNYTVKQSVPSSLISMGEQGLEKFPLGNRSALLERVLRHLAIVAANSELSFAQLLLQQTNYVPSGAIHVLISPQLTKQLVYMLAELSYRHKKIEFFWLKGASDADAQESLGAKQERALLATLRQAGITYHVIEDSQFQQALLERGRYAYDYPKRQLY